jgi:uncharacterized protein (DUF1501 family)
VGAGLPLVLSRTSAALTAQALAGTSIERHPERILVVIELSGGNDGLNTVVPCGDPAYYRARPTLGIPDRDVIKVADGFGFHPSMVGFERLYKDGLLAVVHGCGYAHPSLSHFSSMGYWHTAVPNGGETLGWLGRLADETYDASTRNLIVDLGNSQSLAVRSLRHSRWCSRIPPASAEGTDNENRCRRAEPAGNNDELTLEFWPPRHRTPLEVYFVRQHRLLSHTGDYGAGEGRATAASRPDRREDPHPPLLRHLSGQLFDTHVQQADLHSRLLSTADAVRPIEDLKRIGRAAQVAVMIHEFGRRVEENGSLGPITVPRRRCSSSARASRAASTASIRAQ